MYENILKNYNSHPICVYCRSLRETSDASGTDTASTDEDFDVGGLHFYSHGVLNLVHQHWVHQVQCAGGFRVHNTEAAEGNHKSCMTLPAKRVRHFDSNRTYLAMQKYLQEHLLFSALDRVKPRKKIVGKRILKAGVKLPLRRLIGDVVTTVVMGTDLKSIHRQTSFIHDEVRVARAELLDLLCVKLSLPKSQASYTKLETLQWSFGQKLVLPCGTTYWATDTQYSFYTDHNSRRRRDNFLMHGHEEVLVKLSDGRREHRKTALCCQAVCFVSLQRIAGLKIDIPDYIEDAIVDDGLNLMLVRWFSPHPTASERNSQDLPLCPGPLSINHCLWTYARSTRDRPVLINRDGQPTSYFNEQSFLFGKTRIQQLRSLESERRAYYGLVLPYNVKKTAHMCPEFVVNTHMYADAWMQTITLV